MQNILEIGTAIGYSSMQFASVSNDIHITTIERDEEMITQAKSNFETYGYSSQIRLIEGNALEQYNEVNDKQYDIIFIDAKSSIKEIFEYYTPLLRNGGLVITDNVLYHGFVSNIDIVRSEMLSKWFKSSKI